MAKYYRIISSPSFSHEHEVEEGKLIPIAVPKAIIHCYFIQKRKHFLFIPYWDTVDVYRVTTDVNNNIKYNHFKDYEDAERYLLQMYNNNGRGARIQRIGCVYKIMFYSLLENTCPG